MRLIFIGDLMLGRLVNEVLKNEPPAYPWGDTLPLFNSANWRMANLECVISDRGQPWSATPKIFHFRSDAKNVAVLEAAQIDCLSLANNHTLDFEEEALRQTLQILDKTEIAHAGAGQDIERARQPAIAQIKNQRIGVIAFTDNEPAWEATDQRPGIFYVPIDLGDPRARQLLELVKETKSRVDFLVVSAHWGPNWGYRPPAEHPPFARVLIEAGADIIFGHSGHVFRGVEFFEGKPIIYCAGDFVDDYAVDEVERNDQSFIFVAETANKKIKCLYLYPTVIRDFQARLAYGKEAEEVATKMQKLCREFKTRASWQPQESCLMVGV